MKKYLSVILTISVILSSFVCVMPAFATSNEEIVLIPDEDIKFKEDFSDVNTLAKYYNDYTGNIAIYNTETKAFNQPTGMDYSITSDGTLKMQKNTASKNNHFYIPLTNAISPVEQLVVSYKVKMGSTGGYRYMGQRTNYGPNTVYFNQGKTSATQDSNNISNSIASWNAGEWVNVTIVYDNDTSARDIYINGTHSATANNTSTGNFAWHTSGRFAFVFYFYSSYATANDYVELDDIIYYTVPSELKYKVKSISPASAVLEFNAIPTEYDTDDFEILNTDGTAATTVSSATLSTTNPREVTISFADTLNAGTDYIIKASGVKAGTAKTDDICTDLSVSESDTGVTVTTGRLDNSVYSDVTEIYNQNFAGLTALPSGTFAPLMYSNVSYNTTSRQSLVTESDNAFIRTKGFPANQIIVNTGFLVKNDTYVSADKYILEARVRLNFPDNNAVFKLNESSNMDLKGFPIFANGFIYNTLGDEGLSGIIGTYENNEWMTLTYAVSTAVNENSKYDTEFYLNGQLIQERETDAQPGLTGYAGTANLRTGFYMHGLYKTSADEQSYFDIDYARLIASSSTFGAVIVSDKADCDVDSVTVKFNNLVDTNSLSNAKITLKDSSDTVANVLYIEPVTEANATGYAVKAKLVFDNTLDFNEEYDIYLDDVADINGNKLIFKDTFTTSSNKITSFTITNNTANIEMTASDKNLTLVIAAYSVTDNVEKMEGIKSVTIYAGETTGEVSLTNVPDGATVRAYLLDGFKPIASK